MRHDTTYWEQAKSFGILQKKEEFLSFIDYLLNELPNRGSYLEIGTNNGGTSAIFLKLFESGYSIDMERCANLNRLLLTNKNFIQCNYDSHSLEAYNWVKSLNIKFDMLFIDGDHSLDGVSKDFEMYKEFVSPNGIIVFHDIVSNTTINNEYLQVHEFWEKIKYLYRHKEIINITDYPDSIEILNNHAIDEWGGIGILQPAKKPKQGIIITTHDSTKLFLNDCLESLKECSYDIIIKNNTDINNKWELGGIELGAKLFDEFLYMHDTVIIKDLSILDIIFNRLKYTSVSFLLNYNSYLGKYRTEILNKIQLPVAGSKQEAIHYERAFNETYIKLDGNIVNLFLELNGWELEHNNYEMKHGRNNVVYENQYFKKYKGCWSPAMVE